MLGLLLEDVLPEVCASIIRLKVNTSAMINKAFFMFFSNSSGRCGFRRKQSEKLCFQTSPSAPSLANVYDASEIDGVGRYLTPAETQGCA